MLNNIGDHMTRPLILLVNDDGILSPGLHAVAEAVAPLGDLLIAAPAEQQTAMGRAKPRRPDGGIIEDVTLTINGSPHPAYAVRNSPALCVVHAVTELAPRLPDLCISGINYGENIGFSLTASGTIGAALEAASYGIPALAISRETPLEINFLHEYAPLDWRVAAHFAAHYARETLMNGLPEGVALLNINVPGDATPTTPTRITVQSRRNYYFYGRQDARDFAQPYHLRETKHAALDTLEADSDVRAFAYDRLVSVTPMTGLLSAERLPTLA
jgi:5'-nucleotidase